VCIQTYQETTRHGGTHPQNALVSIVQVDMLGTIALDIAEKHIRLSLASVDTEVDRIGDSLSKQPTSG